MNATQLQQNGYLYTHDEELWQAHVNAMRITRLLNSTMEYEFDKQNALARELFAEAGEGLRIDPPFHCDFGRNTRVGKRFYCCYDCAFLDCGAITIGDNVMLGPKVGLYAVNHPIDPEVRATGLEYGKPITIGSNVWIGGSSVVCPGAVIGNNVVIGAGSVVVGTIPDNVVAAGNPCRVIRPITQEDKTYWNAQLELYHRLAAQE